MTALATTLIPFPGDGPGIDDVVVTASWEVTAGGTCAFRYAIRGAVERLRLPPRGTPRRSDGLWRHTCFEAFVAVGDAGYLEFNFSPSGEWAAYAFAGYRVRAPDPALAPPRIECVATPRTIVLTATLAEPGLPVAAGQRTGPLGLAAVLETTDGALGYFAAHHPAERPDFHDRRGFVLATESAGATA